MFKWRQLKSYLFVFLSFLNLDIWLSFWYPLTFFKLILVMTMPSFVLSFYWQLVRQSYYMLCARLSTSFRHIDIKLVTWCRIGKLSNVTTERDKYFFSRNRYYGLILWHDWRCWKKHFCDMERTYLPFILFLSPPIWFW